VKRIVIIEGPSGAGKDAINRKLMTRHPGKYQKATSYTTREMRDGEIDGVTYNFVDEKTFKEKLAAGDIFEFTIRHGKYRGLSKALIDKVLDSGKIVLKDADLVGINALKKVYPDQILTIWIDVDKDKVAKRMRYRGDSPEDMARRLADYDTKVLEKKHFDFVVDNNGLLDDCVKKVHDIIWKNS